MRRVVCVAVAVLLGACSTVPQKNLPYVRASDVIDALKVELAKVSEKPLAAEVRVNDNDCGLPTKNNSGEQYRAAIIKVHGVQADVALKTVATNSVAGTASGSKVPVNVVLVSPSLTVTRTGIRTQTVTYSFEGNGTLTEQLGPDSTVIRDKPKDEPAPVNKVPFVPIGQTGLRIYRNGKPEEGAPANPDIPNSGIAEAITSARDELLKVDHGLKPCLRPTKLKVEVQFQVQVKVEGKIDVGFLQLINVGTDLIHQKENGNTMTVTFDLAGSSEAFN